MNDERKGYISELAAQVDSISEKYQVVHAAFAIEQMLRDKKQEQHDREIEDLLKEMAQTSDRDKNEELIEIVKCKKKENNLNCRIIISYLSYLKFGCARLHRTASDTFYIGLPKCMECIRTEEDNKIDVDKRDTLRRLMAHELGHIVLHSGILDRESDSLSDDDKELEASFFAECLINLRDTYSAELGEIA